MFWASADLLAGATAGGLLVVAGPEAHHALTVRRLTPGEPVDLVDGAGRRVSGVVAPAGEPAGRAAREQLAVLVGSVLDEPAPAPPVVVVQAVPKSDRAQAAVELLSEVGADAVVPWQAARCIARWDDPARAAKGRERWAGWAREAGKQSRRARHLQVGPPASTREVVARLAAAAVAVVLDEGAGRPLAGLLAELAGRPVPDGGGEIVVVVGPEGGLHPDELAAFGVAPYRLGPSVLRTATAGGVAAALLLAASGRWD